MRGLTMLRWSAVLTAGALALWISIGVTLNFTVGEKYPNIAHKWWPAGVTPKVASAAAALPAPSIMPEKVARMRGSLREAALREPVSSYALGLLGVAVDYQHDSSHARELFQLSEKMSRRNLLTQMWLIEDAVRRDNVSDAIVHYDRAMRVSLESRQTLSPLLVNALGDSLIQKNLLPVLAKHPLWWQDFALTMGKSGEDARGMSAAIIALRPNLANSEERALVERILNKMIALHADRQALRTINQLEGKIGPSRTLQGGGFESALGTPPFAWFLRNDNNIRAFRDLVPNGGYGLRMETQNDTTGDVAWQLIGLAHGHYVLKGTVGNDSANATGRPVIRIDCEHGEALGQFSLPVALGSSRPFRFEFDVPVKDCSTQWVKLTSSREDDTRVWLDNLSITQ